MEKLKMHQNPAFLGFEPPTMGIWNIILGKTRKKLKV